jgi:hypothetical protein
MASPTRSLARPARLLARILWWTHVGVVAFVVAYAAFSAYHDLPEGNIDLAFALLALGGTALPWSLPVLSQPWFGLDSSHYLVTAIGGTVLNLALHAALQTWLRRRGRHSPNA